MKHLFFIMAILLTGDLAIAQLPKVSSGKIIRWENMSSGDIMGRNVDIWLPADYSEKTKYNVLYMSDGQMLFDSSITWNKQEWKLDEWMTGLLKLGKIRNTIVVGIWNNGKYRHAEYYPEKSLQYLEKDLAENLVTADLQGKPLADKYLEFIVKVVKPKVDSSFSTLKGKENTFIMGSSMGGLISMYAMCEYPDVFGGAACLSTHWVGSLTMADHSIPKAFATYMGSNIPSPKDHRIYFDHGTVGLDSLYGQWQIMIDELMSIKGYAPGNYVSRVYNGTDHSEKSWSARLDRPLIFLLGKK
jgi:predicted alpha/beta superfamily hydrolase